MGIFRQISTELCPLIDVKNCSNPLFFFLLIFFRLCMGVDVGKECFRIADGYNYLNIYRVMALDC